MLRKTIKRCTLLLCTVIGILTLASAYAQDHPPPGKLIDGLTLVGTESISIASAVEARRW